MNTEVRKMTRQRRRGSQKQKLQQQELEIEGLKQQMERMDTEYKNTIRLINSAIAVLRFDFEASDFRG